MEVPTISSIMSPLSRPLVQQSTRGLDIIISLLTKNNDNTAMYIIDITIISYILLLIFDIGFSIISNTISYITM